MILESAINKLIRDSINSILDYPEFAISAKDNGPRPSGPYASVNVTTDRGVGWEEKIGSAAETDADVNETIQGYREITISLGFYRDGNVVTSAGEEFTALDNARFVRTGLMRENIKNMWRQANIGLLTRSEVRDIAELLDGNLWEKRGQFDLTLSAIGSDRQLLRAINTVSIYGEFQTKVNIIPINVEVDV